ncbi:hypothetical protein Fot_33547 [Forsythia ovata]|uniref:Uncharacterized protein n=1 Tax=Forsythia ovata TaxID=205694 RepID=A0ABD1TBF4_9LAMI
MVVKAAKNDTRDRCPVRRPVRGDGHQNPRQSDSVQKSRGRIGNRAPKSLLSLGDILDEYIRLKEQKVILDQGWCRLEQEKSRVQNLLRGMQDVMNAYNSTGDNITPPSQLPSPLASNTMTKSGAAGHFPTYNTPAIMSTPDPTSHSNTKRKGSKGVTDALVTAKKSRRCIPPKDSNIVTQEVNAEKKQGSSVQDSAVQSYIHDNSLSELSQGSNVVKCLFTQPTPSPPANYSSGPKTPPQASSSQTEKSISPLEICSPATSSDITQQITSTNCTVISSETIRVSPAKQIAYYSIEKTRCISTSSPVKTHLKRLNKKENVKGRLDFDVSDIRTISENSPVGTSTSEFDRDGDILDLDIPNLDDFGLDFNLSELLVEFDLHSEGPGFSYQQPMDSSPHSHLG